MAIDQNKPGYTGPDEGKFFYFAPTHTLLLPLDSLLPCPSARPWCDGCVLDGNLIFIASHA